MPRALLTAALIWLGTAIPASAEPARVSAPVIGNAPTIDGQLNDPIWAQAGRIDDLVSLEPNAGSKPAKQTEVLVAQTRDALYIAIIAHDDEPHKIKPTIGERDGTLWKDDHVRIFLDPLNTGRNGYSFEVNANGARREALISDNRRYVDQWDTIWNAAAQVTDQGWVAEIEIPFRSIGFQRGVESWGFQINRQVPRTNEQMRWAHAKRTVVLFDLSKVGTLDGFAETDPPGIGLDIRPVSTARYIKRYGNAADKQDFDLIPSGFISYGLTPSLTGTVTAQPDFSDAPIDQRQVNTGRFSLFFPETRDFFLGDANLFRFGGLALSGDMGETQNGQPFFSRRIGIEAGRNVNIPWGAKISGAVGGTTIGALSAQTQSDAAGAEQLSVIRTSSRVGDGLSVGTIATYGNSRTQTDNWLGGLDVQWETKIGNQRLLVDGFTMVNGSSDADFIAPAHGVEVNVPNDKIGGRISFKEFDADYFPGLGFANRTGIREFDSELRWRKRWAKGTAGRLRYIDLETQNTVTLNQDNALESAKHVGIARARLWPSDIVELHAIQRVENIETPFLVAGKIPVGAGTYRDHRFKGYLYLTPLRPYGAEVSVECCGFFDGRQLTVKASFDIRPSPFFNLILRYRLDEIDLPGGDVAIHIGSVDSRFNITPDMQIAVQGEFDTLSSALASTVRFRWHIRPQTELFIGVTHGGQIIKDRFESISTETAIRIGNTFRF
ncbi:MAG: sugar-binding protein [Alphaproteobacteria bacterium]